MSGSLRKASYHHSITMVRVPEPSGDSEFYFESLREEVKIKNEPGIETTAKEGSSQTREEEGSSDRQSFRRGFNDKNIKEKDRLHDMEGTPPP